MAQEYAYLEVSDNLLEGVSAASYDLLDDVAEVVDQEVERLSVLRNRSKLLMLVPTDQQAHEHLQGHLRHQSLLQPSW